MSKKLQNSAPDEQDLYETALNTIKLASKIPFVRVDRNEFLKEQFQESPYLEEILKLGPQAVFSQATLRKHANK